MVVCASLWVGREQKLPTSRFSWASDLIFQLHADFISFHLYFYVVQLHSPSCFRYILFVWMRIGHQLIGKPRWMAGVCWLDIHFHTDHSAFYLTATAKNNGSSMTEQTGAPGGTGQTNLQINGEAFSEGDLLLQVMYCSLTSDTHAMLSAVQSMLVSSNHVSALVLRCSQAAVSGCCWKQTAKNVLCLQWWWAVDECPVSVTAWNPALLSSWVLLGRPFNFSVRQFNCL